MITIKLGQQQESFSLSFPYNSCKVETLIVSSTCSEAYFTIHCIFKTIKK